MTAKVEIAKLIREQAALFPSLSAEALNANDRIALRLTILQVAAADASSVESAAPSPQAERHAAGLSDPQSDRFAAGVATMLAPVEAVDGESGKSLRARSVDLQKRIPSVPDSAIGRDEITRMTSTRRGHEDSLDLVVMDAHKAQNQAAARTAIEAIDGAHAHHLDPDDRDRVAAIMRGLNRTAPLAGDWLSIDSEGGKISSGQARIVIERPEAELAELKRWSGQANWAPERGVRPLGKPIFRRACDFGIAPQSFADQSRSMRGAPMVDWLRSCCGSIGVSSASFGQPPLNCGVYWR
jgi:hypothetical protein